MGDSAPSVAARAIHARLKRSRLYAAAQRAQPCIASRPPHKYSCERVLSRRQIAQRTSQRSCRARPSLSISAMMTKHPRTSPGVTSRGWRRGRRRSFAGFLV